MLVELLRARPDLAMPAPSDSTVLATRAGTRARSPRLRRLDTFTLAVLDALLLADADRAPVPVGDVSPARRPHRRGGRDAASPGCARRARLGRGRRASRRAGRTRGAGAFPAGLGPSAPLLAGDDLTRARRLSTRRRDGCSARSPTARRSAGPGTPARSPLERAAHRCSSCSPRGLLIRRDDRDRRAAARARRRAARRDPFGPVRSPSRAPTSVPFQPPLWTRPRPARPANSCAAPGRAARALVGGTAAGAARPAGSACANRSRLAKELDIDEHAPTCSPSSRTAPAWSLASQATEPEWTLTTQTDTWLARRPRQRWTTLAAGLAGPAAAARARRLRDDKDKPLAPLSDELRRPLAPRARRRTLDAFADFPPGAALARAPTSSSTLLAWRAPRRGGRLRDEPPLDDARSPRAGHRRARRGHLGRPRPARRRPAAAAKTLVAALPALIDHVLVQADLTVIAPGPLDRTSPSRWPWSPTSNRPGTRPSTGSPRRPSGARSTPAAPRRTARAVQDRSRRPRSRRRSTT